MRDADAANLELAGRTNGAGGATVENGSFQALLERLQQFASAPKEAPKVDGLQAAMRDADQSFTTAMDLRRQLEEAFRRHLS